MSLTQAKLENQRLARKTKKRFLADTYYNMSKRVSGRHAKWASYVGLPLINREAFFKWALHPRNNFHQVWKAYKESGWDRRLVPSIDKFKRPKGYSKGNMKFISMVDHDTARRKPKNKA